MGTKLERYVHEESGLRFYFGWDRHQPSVLHVEARGTTVEDAIQAYLNATITVYDAEHRRFETRADTHGVYWALYNNRPGHVLIISCFKLEE